MAAGEETGPIYGEVRDAMRAYVMGPETMNRGETTILVGVSHSNLKLRVLELRVDLHMTVTEAKDLLYTYCGSKTAYMRLEVYSGDSLKCVLSDSGKKLGFYSLEDGDRIHIVDTDPNSLSKGGGLDDVSQVKKYVMSDEEYAKRKGTLRSWKEEMKKKDPTFTYAKYMRMNKAKSEISRLRRAGEEPSEDLLLLAEGKDPEIEHARERGEARRMASEGKTDDATKEEEEEDDTPMPESLKDVAVGQRCEVYPGGCRGEVAYVGKVVGAKGYWVGVKFDEPNPKPKGKADGTAKGNRYFECTPGYGGFLKPENVKVGDFPSLDDELFADDDDEL